MIQFETPSVFLALIALVPFLIFCVRRSYADLPTGRKWLSFGARTVGLTALLLALSKPILVVQNDRDVVLYLLDVSDSVRGEALDAAVSRIARETEGLGSGRSAGLVLFARHPVLVVTPGQQKIVVDDALRDRIFHAREKERGEAHVRELERSELGQPQQDERVKLKDRLASIARWREDLGVDDTDLEAALRLARGTLPGDARRRIVVLSDGNATRGDVLRELSELKRAGVVVDTVALRRDDAPEVMASRVEVPSEVRVKAPFDLAFTITSNRTTPAEVRVFRNKFLIATKAVDLKPGKNVVEVSNLALEEGFHEFEATVQAKADTVVENNTARAAVRVAGRPKVLLVDGNVSEARYLEEALAAEEIQVEVRPDNGIPEEMNDLLNFDAVILSDVPATKMTTKQMENIKRYVRETGGGFVMLGGEKSFGLGGYYRTPIEDILPVRMPIRKNIEKPNLAIVLVIDRSGSMTGEKIQLAKEAAIASAEVLKDKDLFGVIAFDSLAQWICEITRASERDTITQLIGRLIAGGGTNIYPALYNAYKALLDTDAKLKHIILLTDGVTEGTGYRELVARIAADDITVSTVGIGDDADQKLLKEMAEGGNGEFYYTNDFATIPQILTRETLRASKSMLVEEPFQPKVQRSSDVLKGIDMAAAPFLLGYVGTQPKERATVSLVSEYGDPILAEWRCGLGRTLAFTSDAKSRWAGDWISWPAFSKFWGQAVRSVMSTGAHHDVRTEARVSIAGGVARLTLDVRSREGGFLDDIRPEVSLLGETAAAATTLDVQHVAPGLYTAEVPIKKFGDFQRLMIVQKQKDEIVGLKALAFTESYSPEFRQLAVDDEALRSIATTTGGTFDPPAGAAWTFAAAPARSPHETWPWWLGLALLLLPLDIALRRLGWHALRRRATTPAA